MCRIPEHEVRYVCNIFEHVTSKETMVTVMVSKISISNYLLNAIAVISEMLGNQVPTQILAHL